MSDTTAVLDKWRSHPFFSDDKIVLGLDIGIEGIGIAVRRGTELLHCETLMVNLPKANALAQRRALRAARHARKNYRVRMNRLQKLFARHHLPWVSDEVYSRSDPFRLRYRAITKQLASKEALSLCIRSCVALRGYDYFAMSRDEGEYPWGASPDFSDAKKWLSSSYIDESLKAELKELAPDLLYKNNPLNDAKIEEWKTLVDEREKMAGELGIPAMLKKYNSCKCSNYRRRARGHNYPRAHVETHLRNILERHRGLIDDYDSFVAALFLPNKTRANKRHSIFHYNRKIKDEADKLFQRKVKDCPYCSWLGLPQKKCGFQTEPEIRCWNLLGFVANRRFECTQDKLPAERILLPEKGVQALIDAINNKVRTWNEAKKALEKAIKPHSILLNNDWNKGQLAQLKDIVAPSSGGRKGRASISCEAAGKLVQLVTKDGYAPEKIEAARKEIGLYEKLATIEATGGIYPQVQSLLGVLRTNKRKREELGPFATSGRLQRLFEKELAPLLNGKTSPDYCVIECVRDTPINAAQKEEREKAIKDNRKARETRAKRYNREKLSKAAYLRMRLFEEQGGNPQTNAICPFTGKKLGTDPFSSELQLAHLYPDSRGGLYMAENLVLTTQEINQAMGNRTPLEATKAHVHPDWSTWEEQQQRIKNFGWNQAKLRLYTFEPRDGETFPDFNNMTRTAQLAAELRRMVAVWMGIGGDAEALRKRIGNPNGLYTDAARRGMLWDEYKKDRSNNLHHRLDAAVMTCIPPAEGINDVQYGGIFCTEKIEKNRRFTCIKGLPLPDFREEWDNPKGCPVVDQVSHSKSKPLGDSTFWRVDEEKGITVQHTSLDKLDDKKKTANTIYTGLAYGIPAQLIPNEHKIQEWITGCQEAVQNDPTASDKPLRLLNGAPVRRIWKKTGGKLGNVCTSPLGWSGIMTAHGKFHQMRKLDEVNDRMEIWLGWNTKKKKWEYYKRVVPTATTLAGLKRLGLPWRGQKGAPDYLIKLLGKKGVPDLKTMICGKLPKDAKKVGSIRKGMIFKLDFELDPKELEKQRKKDPHFDPQEHAPIISTYGKVSSIKSEGTIGFTALLTKIYKKKELQTTDALAQLLGKPDASELAEELDLTPPA